MVRGGRLAGVLVVLALGLGGATIPALAVGGPGGGSAGGSVGGALRIFSTPPVLVRAGEQVLMPVDVSCSTPAGTPCSPTATVSVREGFGPWVEASSAGRPDLQVDLTAPASRAVTATSSSGSVAYVIRAADPLGRRAATPSSGEAAPLRFYVTKRMRSVSVPVVPFGRVSRGSTVLYLPWGTGRTKVGLVPGNESPTVGPSSFDVDRRGRIYLLDALQDRLAVFGNGGLVREARVVAGSRPDLAVADDGTAYVLSTQADPGGAMLVQRIGPSAGLPDMTVPVGSGIPVAIRTAADRAYVDALPLDAWVAVGAGDTGPQPENVRMGRPLGDGSELLTVVHGDAVRLARVRGGTVDRAVELRSSVPLGEVALAEPDAHGGYVVVVHIWREHPTAADQYQVIHVTPAGAVTAFAVANREFAETAPLSKFRLGEDGDLYEMTSSPDGVRIVRFQIGGES